MNFGVLLLILQNLQLHVWNTICNCLLIEAAGAGSQVLHKRSG